MVEKARILIRRRLPLRPAAFAMRDVLEEVEGRDVRVLLIAHAVDARIGVPPRIVQPLHALRALSRLWAASYSEAPHAQVGLQLAVRPAIVEEILEKVAFTSFQKGFDNRNFFKDFFLEIDFIIAI